jgi:FkbM family methyltransferase
MLYNLSRFSAMHRLFRAAAYGILWRTPDSVKWPVLGAFLHGGLPYRVVESGDVVVQIGAPWDLLKAGRSRAIHFSRVVGESGKVVVIEPDQNNLLKLDEFIKRRKIKNVVLVPLGAWSKKTRLRFLVDPDNPAANLVEDVVDSSRTDLRRFKATEIDVDTVEAILKSNGIRNPKLISITTNGSEDEILKGMQGISASIPYIATIGDESQIPMLQQLSFRKLGGDDRGFTFRNERHSA